MPRTTPEQAWNRVRHGVGRALGPLAAPRTGWFFVVRRGVSDRVTRAVAHRPTRAGNEAVELTELASAFPQVRMHPAAPEQSSPGLPLPEPAASDPRAAPVLRPWTARAQAVLEIPGGVALGPNGWAGLDDRHLLITEPMTRWRFNRNQVRRECAWHAEAPVIRRPGRTAVVPQHLDSNYAHCLVQGFPGLDMIDRTVGLGSVDRFLVRETIRPFAIEMLTRLGVDPEQLERVPMEAPSHYECETLITTTFVESDYPGPSGVIEPIRRHFADEIDLGGAAPRRRWYVSRRAPSRRLVENESAVREMLATRGFEPLVMDDRTVAEQARLLASAECVVGIHGAALANLVFALPGTPVIELMPANICQWMFGRLAQSAGLAYDTVLGAEPGPPASLVQFLVDADLRIDVDHLARRVDAALAG